MKLRRRRPDYARIEELEQVLGLAGKPGILILVDDTVLRTAEDGSTTVTTAYGTTAVVAEQSKGC